MTEPWDLPDRQIKVTMMLADYAQVADGKMNVIGAGWTVTGPQPAPFAIALLLEVPWNLANVQHQFRMELIDLDGVPVAPLGSDEPIVIEGQFEIGRPAGTRTGTALPFMAALNSGPLPLEPGGDYEWRLAIDGETREEWRLAFSTRPEVG
jgi:hypothetical protein